MMGFSIPTARASRAIALAAATMAAATSPTLANDFATKHGIPPECANKGSEVAQLKCGTDYFKKKTAEANARGAAADKRGAAADRRIMESQKTIDTARATKICVDAISEEITAEKNKGPLTPDQKASFRSRILACSADNS